MNNENNEEIIIEGGITEITFNEKGMFPVTIPIEEIKVYGNKMDKNHGIPTMNGFIIFIGSDAQSRHGGRIKVMRSNTRNKDFKNHDYYDEFYYANGQVERIDPPKTSKTNFNKKELEKIKEFFMRNQNDILLNSNKTPYSERIDDNELFSRIFNTEMEFYKNGGK